MSPACDNKEEINTLPYLPTRTDHADWLVGQHLEPTAAMTSQSTNKLILNKPEGWDEWMWELRSKADQDIWPCIDPMVEDDEVEPLIEKPTVPKFNQVKLNARRITTSIRINRKHITNCDSTSAMI